MAGFFFSRFIPSATKGAIAPSADQVTTRKRVLDALNHEALQPSPKRPKKSQGPRSSQNSEPIQKVGTQNPGRSEVVIDSLVHESQGDKKSAIPAHGDRTASTVDHSEAIQIEKETWTDKRNATGRDIGPTEVATYITGTKEARECSPRDRSPYSKPDRKKSPKKQRRIPLTQPEDKPKIAETAENKHSKILSRFKNSVVKSKTVRTSGLREEDSVDGPKETVEQVIAHGLEPLPQPAPTSEPDEKPSYSSLPAWLANPIVASAHDRTKFADLKIDPKMLRALDDHGYQETFAVQSTVIPLLLPGPRHHPGDLCISAPTGSGKTLAYVLPLISALSPGPVPRLRGLIVVPTRELVKQVQQTCELCSARMGLRIGTSLGNVAIKDERRALMRVDSIYNPEASQEQQQKVMMVEDWAEFNLQDYTDKAQEFNLSLPGYVNHLEPNVDILISTPGRLVDHIRFTKGFTLRHVQWLVIDEADRLLNESFQEWVAVVINSLDTGNTPDNFILSSGLNFAIRKRKPKKVVLSATMTRDISKLNSLRLTNPKFVIGAPESGDSTVLLEGATMFALPPKLKEFSVSTDDESKKPLYLLSLLLHHIKAYSTEKHSRRRRDLSGGHPESDGSLCILPEGSSEFDSSSSSSTGLRSRSASDGSTDSGNDRSNSSLSTGHTPRVLVFAKSSEAASRLSRLLSLLHPPLGRQMGTMIKSSKSSASRKTLSAYRQGKISIIVATDRASRGIDLPHLTDVVNYDIPTSITTYVHRVGRTARAGNEGSAWTLVVYREGRWFSSEIVKGKVSRSRPVEKVNLNLPEMADIESQFDNALKALEKAVTSEYCGLTARSRS
jgi:ATP-dependent RNA helicase DDX51/DBP6